MVMGEYKEFNINSYVKVKLTDHGRDVLRKDHDTFWETHRPGYEMPYTPPEEDEQGYSRWQLWDLMHRLGQHIAFGRNLVFETNIFFEASRE